MKCPYCDHEFPLTWKRYWQSPTGRHECPSCHQRSRLRPTPGSWIRIFLGVSVGGIPAGWLMHLWFGRVGWIGGWLLGAFLTGVPLDRYFDDKVRRLEKCEDRKVS